MNTITLHSPVDILAMVPGVLGFHPDLGSIVWLSFGGEHPVHARVDIPPDREEFEDVAKQLVHIALANNVGRAALVVYDSDVERARELDDVIRNEALGAGILILAEIATNGERWFGLGNVPISCPPEGQPYDLSESPLLAEMALDGEAPMPSRASVVESLNSQADDTMLALCEEAGDRAMYQAGEMGARPFLVQEALWVREIVRLGQERTLTQREIARLVGALQVIEVRDVAWAEITRENAARHVELWTDVARRAPLEGSAPVSALLAFAAWMSGNGGLSQIAVARAFEDVPDYSMAKLIGVTLATAMPPSTWTPFSEDLLTIFTAES